MGSGQGEGACVVAGNSFWLTELSIILATLGPSVALAMAGAIWLATTSPVTGSSFFSISAGFSFLAMSFKSSWLNREEAVPGPAALTGFMAAPIPPAAAPIVPPIAVPKAVPFIKSIAKSLGLVSWLATPAATLYAPPKEAPATAPLAAPRATLPPTVAAVLLAKPAASSAPLATPEQLRLAQPGLHYHQVFLGHPLG